MAPDPGPPPDLPLLDLFTRLRQDFALPIGVDDYLLALAALSGGFGLANRAALEATLAVLWTTSAEEARLLRQVLGEVLAAHAARIDAPVAPPPTAIPTAPPAPTGPDAPPAPTRGRPYALQDSELTDGSAIPVRDVRGATLEIIAEFEPGDATEVGIMLRCSADGREQTRVLYDVADQRLVLDVSLASLSDTAHLGRHAGLLRLSHGETVRLHIFLDGSVVEIFGSQRACATGRIYRSRDDSLGIAPRRAWGLGAIAIHGPLGDGIDLDRKGVARHHEKPGRTAMQAWPKRRKSPKKAQTFFGLYPYPLYRPLCRPVGADQWTVRATSST